MTLSQRASCLGRVASLLMHASGLTSVTACPAVAKVLSGVTSANWTCSVRLKFVKKKYRLKLKINSNFTKQNKKIKIYLEPLVDASGMELVGAGQNPQRLQGLKVAHANHAVGLVALVGVGVELVGRQLLDLGARQSPRLGLAQPLGKGQQGLVVLRLGRLGRR